MKEVSDFEQDVYGAEELGPYAIERTGLNTQEVMDALNKGYIPQIVVVNYDMTRVADSNYNPGVDNLKIVEETSKGRTAYITISGTSMRESYRVCAFDVDAQGNISPGISLKKALFNIYASRVGRGESWESDYNRKDLTVDDSGLKWKANAVDPYGYCYSLNKTGNAWQYFETYVKNYKDANNITHYIETIKRIGSLSKYNPFDSQDNPNYDPNQLLNNSDIRKMKYWYVLHNGKYYEGDLNDPIWVGDRYEIICVDIDDFNNHFARFSYTPLQCGATENFDTRWNSLSNFGPFARSRYFGKLYQGDCVTLEVDLKESRFLQNPTILNGTSGVSTWNSSALTPGNPFSLGYLTESSSASEVSGIPGAFDFAVYGGVNNIAVVIGNADNALSYTITVASSDNSYSKTFNVSSSALINSGNTFNINRNTLDKTGTPCGVLPAVSGGSIYQVNVVANGILYNVSVTKNANEINLTADCTLPNDQPGYFTFSSNGLTNGLVLNISQGTNTEYYEIDCVGPLNGSSPDTTQKFYGSSGYDQFTIPSDASVPSGNPGVYLINVYAINNMCVGHPEIYTTRFTGMQQYVTVGYEQFTQQKNLRAQLWNTLSMNEAVNLEVNFNDGSGWYKLLTRGTDPYFIPNSYLDKYIDCRYYNYVDYQNQKFYVAFQPPDGTSNPPNNVFLGGRDTVDLSIRTQPRPEYRDRYWPRSDANINITFPGAFPNGSIPSFPYAWIHGYGAADFDDTDATNLTTTSLPPSGFFSLSSYDPTKYFFSPFEYRVYGITATISGDMMALASQNAVDYPTFTASASGDCAINIPLITSNYCTTYTVCYRQVVVPSGASANVLLGIGTQVVGENPLTWNTLPSSSATSATITGLVPNTPYAVAIVGKNANQQTKGAWFNGETDSNHSTTFITPFSTATPAAPVNFTLSLQPAVLAAQNIQVSNIYSANADSYTVAWRKHWDTNNWQYISVDPLTDGNPASKAFAGVTGELYDVQVFANNSHAATGSTTSTGSVVLQIATNDYLAINLPITVVYDSGAAKALTSFSFNRSDLPTNYKGFRASGVLTTSVKYYDLTRVMTSNSSGWISVVRYYTLGKNITSSNMPLSTVNVLTITEHLTPDQYLLDAGIPSASIAGNGVNGFNPTGAGGYPWSNPGQSGIDYFPFPQYFSHRIQLTFVFTDQNGIEHPYYYDSGQIAQGQQPQ